MVYLNFQQFRYILVNLDISRAAHLFKHYVQLKERPKKAIFPKGSASFFHLVQISEIGGGVGAGRRSKQHDCIRWKKGSGILTTKVQPWRRYG